MKTKRTYTAITCQQAKRLLGSAPRHYGYTIAIDPPIAPEPDVRTHPWPAEKLCDSCGFPPVGQLYDITSCGDWLTVCGTCRDRIQGPPALRKWQGWYKFKADAERRAQDANAIEGCTWPRS